MDHSHQFDSEGEVSDNHSITTDVVDGFERKSFELLEYINSLEAKLEQQRYEFDQRVRQLEEEKICVEQKLEIGLQHAQLENARLQQDHHKFVEEAERTIQSLRKDVEATDSSLRKERRRVQDLENTVTDLKHQLLQKQQSYSHQKATHEKEMDRLEQHVNMLRKKVSLGWILGRLTEVYLRMEPLQQAGGESGDAEGAASKAVNIDRIEKEVRCLIDSEVQSPKSNDASTSTRPSIPPRQSVISSDDEESESEKDDEFERRIRNLRRIRRGENVSPRSRNVRKQRSDIADAEASPARTKPSCDQGNDSVQADIQIMTHTETRTRSSGQNSNMIQAPNAGVGATMRLTKSSNSHSQRPSKSPPRGINKPMTSLPSPPRSPKKDVACIKQSSPCEAAAVNSSNPPHKDISRRRRDIQKFISNMKSKTKITSASTNFMRDA